MKAFLTFVLSSVLAASVIACSNEDASTEDLEPIFASLLLVVEDGESILETFNDEIVSSLEALIDCSNVGDTTCERELSTSQVAIGKFMSQNSILKVSAELQALRLIDFPRMAQARDEYLAHLRAWQDHYFELQSVLRIQPSDLQRNEFWDSFNGVVGEGESTMAIRETFDRACSALGDAQPEKSAMFYDRIVDVCDD